ncbi:unnamed protein product [Parajaminaea phylloscopi]
MATARKAAPGWDLGARPFPQAKRGDVVDTYKSKKDGEVKIADPFRWLEQPPSQSPETKKWVEEQADFAQAYIKEYKPRAELKKRIEENFSYPRFSCPSLKYDGNFYYSYNSGLEPQSRFFKASREQIDKVEQEGSDAEAPGTVFFDANALSKDGTVALTLLAFSRTGKKVAYGISKSGSDWFSIYFRSTEVPFAPAGPDVKDADKGGEGRMADELHHIKFSDATWTHDDSGIFYQTFPKPDAKSTLGSETDPNREAELFYHRLGTQQSEDRLICGVDPNLPTGMWGTEISDDGKFLLVTNSKNTDPKSRYYVAALNEDGSVPTDLKWLALADKFEYQLSFLASDGNVFYFMTNKDAPRYRIVKVTADMSQAQSTKEPWSLSVNSSVKVEELVPEDHDQAVLSSATVVDGDKLLLVYSRNVIDELYLHDLKTGKQITRLLPDLVGSIGQISGKREDQTAFVSSSSFISPGTITRLQWTGGKPKEEPQIKTHRATKVKGIAPEDYVSEQRWFESADGTRVPMFLTYHKDTQLNGTAPAWLYAYGGFQITLSPAFSPSMMTWVTMYGGVLAWVNARGGGEFGESWHEGGRRFNKHHTFQDVLSASKYLHENQVAAKGKIILNGGSNGGMTVMASLNMAKEEHGVGAGVAEVGVLDALRFNLFTIGSAWVADYGNPQDPADFDFIRTFSPLHNVQDRPYPTTVFLTGDHDDRVSPLHTFKMTAEMQHRLKDNPNPILCRIDLNSGHGAGKSLAKRIEETCDKYAAVARALDLQVRK